MRGIRFLVVTFACVAASLFDASAQAPGPADVFIHREKGAVPRAVRDRLSDTLHVRDFVTGGDGTQAVPWTGWCTVLAFERSKTYFFTDGWYACGQSLNWRKGGARFIGQSSRGTVIKFTGTGNIVELDGGATNVVGLDGTGQTIENLRLVGNASATNCIYVRNTHHFTVRNVRCNDFTGAGIYGAFSIHALVEDWVVSANEGLAGAVTCTNGIRLVGDSKWGFAGNWTFVNPITGGCSGYGIELGEQNAANNVIINGASESNGLGCVRMMAYAQSNKVHGLYCNNNAVDNGSVNQWHGLTGGGPFAITSGRMNTVYGGLFTSITVGTAASDNTFIGVTYSYPSPGSYAFTDGGTRTQRIAVRQFGTTPKYDDNTLQGRLVLPSGAGLQWGGGTEPACNSTNRGLTMLVKGGAGVKDTFRLCAKDAGEAYAWRTVY